MDRYRVYLGNAGVWTEIALPGSQGDRLLAADADIITVSIAETGTLIQSGGVNLSVGDTFTVSISESPSMVDKAIPEETISFEAADFESAGFE